MRGPRQGTSLGALLCCMLVSSTQAFYIPGWSIKSFHKGDSIPLTVNKASSDQTQLQYAYAELPFVCPPTGRQQSGLGLLSGQSISLNLGEVLRGDRIVVSDMELSMLNDVPCNVLCHKELNREDVARARDMVDDGYVVEWIVDNLPGATSFVTVDQSRKYYAAGFKLGFVDKSSETPRYYLHNHHTIVIRYRAAPGTAGDRGEKVIVGFEVYPKSISASARRTSEGCPESSQNIDEHLELYISANSSIDGSDILMTAGRHNKLNTNGTLIVPYSYSVYFREAKDIEWSKRWDLYFVNQEESSRIHTLAIVNSLIICGLLTGLVFMILAKTIKTDLQGRKNGRLEAGPRSAKAKKSSVRSPKEKKTGGLLEQEGGLDNDESSDEETVEDITGWKLLHADVFRTPEYGWLLAPLIGSGMQLLFVAVGLVSLGALGVLNPSFRGGFISFGVGLFVFAGLFSGYFSARIYRTFDGKDFQRNAMVTAVLFPGLLFVAVFQLDLFVWAQASSTAIPFGTLIALLFLWLGIQVPLVFVGSWVGFHKGGAWQHPTKTASIARQIPRRAWFIKSVRSALLAGLIPFAVSFIEVMFVFQSIWQDKTSYYYVFGFLGFVSLIMITTVGEVTIVMIYIQLCAEIHQWWWQSFLVGAGSTFWLFGYCCWYYFVKLHITGFVSSMLFFVYSALGCVMYGLLTGTVGFLCAYAFVRRLYGAIKVD